MELCSNFGSLLMALDVITTPSVADKLSVANALSLHYIFIISTVAPRTTTSCSFVPMANSALIRNVIIEGGAMILIDFITRDRSVFRVMVLLIVPIVLSIVQPIPRVCSMV